MVAVRVGPAWYCYPILEVESALARRENGVCAALPYAAPFSGSLSGIGL